jgi:murein DD-endopeptidase MepM/ murein hydrolase activator NlpD
MTWTKKIRSFSSKLLNSKTTYKPNTFFNKVAITVLAISGISITSVSSAHAEDNESELQTIYHVYLDEQYAGAVTDKTLIEKAKEEKINKVEEEHSNFEIDIDKELSFVPEQVFRNNVNNQTTVKTFNESVTAKAEAVSLQINGEPVVYVKDQIAAEELMKQLKLKYVSEEELTEYEARKKASSNELPPLKKGETRILEISAAEDLKFNATEVEPQEVLSPEKAVELLLKGTLEENKYKVQSGDALSNIAEEHNMSTSELFDLNPSLKEDGVLLVGTEINVTVTKPLIHVNIKREARKQEKIAHEKEVVEDSSMYKGDMKIKQEGQDGERTVTYLIEEQNGDVTKKTEKDEEIIKEPIKHIVIRGTKVTPSRGSGNFVWPTNGGYVSSKMGPRWGKVHKGIDIARPDNKTIKAIDNGTVISAGFDDGGYGNKVIIDHNNGYKSVYAHLSSIDVSVGETVSAGSKIGNMGSTGQSTGVHLHIEIYKNGSRVNPLELL